MVVKVKVEVSKQAEKLFNEGLKSYSTKLLKRTVEDLKIELQRIADGALLAMRNFITTQAKNPEGRLERALTVEFRQTKNEVSFGIGNTNKLTREAPYWYVLNYGRTISGGKFIPQGFIGYVNDGRPIAGESNKTETLKNTGIMVTRI